jgi:shikimate kinase
LVARPARGASVQILNNVIVRNSAYNAAGVYLRYANVQMINNTIAYNSSQVSSTGGSIYLSDETTALLANNIVAFQQNGPNYRP